MTDEFQQDRICVQNTAQVFGNAAVQSWLLYRHRSGYHIFTFLISEKKVLRDDEILQHLHAGSTVTIYFRDLGPQIGWTKVRNGLGSYYNIIFFYLYWKMKIENIALNMTFWYAPERKILT